MNTHYYVPTEICFVIFVMIENWMNDELIYDWLKLISACALALALKRQCNLNGESKLDP